MKIRFTMFEWRFCFFCTIWKSVGEESFVRLLRSKSGLFVLSRVLHGIHSGNLRVRCAFLGQDGDGKNRDDRSLLEKYVAQGDTRWRRRRRGRIYREWVGRCKQAKTFTCTRVVRVKGSGLSDLKDVVPREQLFDVTIKIKVGEVESYRIVSIIKIAQSTSDYVLIHGYIIMNNINIPIFSLFFNGFVLLFSFFFFFFFFFPFFSSSSRLCSWTIKLFIDGHAETTIDFITSRK